jgi:protocatechuate 3,4-dioxygenase beta subunit
MRNVLFALFAVGVVATTSASAGCGNRYLVGGRVLDASGRPLADARVYVLLDRISEKKFGEQGLRAVRIRTDAAGRYTAHIECGARPNPCAASPKHVTVAVAGESFRMKLQVHKLKTLGVDKGADACRVVAPDLVAPWSGR